MSFDKSELFKREEAIILGYMLSRFFTVAKAPGFTGSYGNRIPFLKGDGCEDGSGDWPRGRHGKPPYATANGDLPGSGGSLSGGGWGVSVGTFGFGGNGRGYTSSGGGGGFFGGGSGYVKAGGGGGCSYYWQGSQLVSGYMEDVTDFDPVFYRGCDFGLLDGIGNLNFKTFTQRNMGFGHGSLAIKQVAIGELIRTGQLGYFCTKSGFSITEGESSNTYNITDIITGGTDIVDETELIAEQKFDFQLGYIEYVIPHTGFYLISGYGAQGGGGSSSQDTTDTMVGGCGAYSQCLYLLKGGTTLYIQIGQFGGNIKAPARPQGGGGGAASNGYGGGGATSVYLIAGNQFTRLFVAGGGGGAGYGSGKDSPGLDKNNKNRETIEPEQKDDKFKTDKQMFIISDLSIAYVDITYKTSFDIPEGKSITVSLYVDGVKRGILTRDAIAGGGFDSWKFDNFDQWLPPNTKPYWATIEAVVETNLEQMTIPINGLIIRVETKTRPNDANPILRNIFGYIKDKVAARSYLDFMLQSYKNELSDLENIRSPIGARSFIDIFIKTVKKLHNEGVSKICADSFVEFYFGEKEDEGGSGTDFTDLQYVTSKVGAGSYVAFFMTQKAKAVPLDALSKGGAGSFMQVHIKTVPELRIDTISTVKVDNLNKIEEG